MSGRCHGLECPGHTKNKQRSTSAELRTGAYGGPQRKEDKRKEPVLDHPGKMEQTGSRAHTVRGRARRRHDQDELAA